MRKRFFLAFEEISDKESFCEYIYDRCEAIGVKEKYLIYRVYRKTDSENVSSLLDGTWGPSEKIFAEVCVELMLSTGQSIELAHIYIPRSQKVRALYIEAALERIPHE